ncbi:MAG: PHB depolymerase family esterase [Sphingopyxis sp.]|uniref:alpha/beta hydrolase family esterase n=1 Tax=Sphingopyxis sp. TaxID=1908224 RepID=UPI002ABC9387|nr:PHB depolymerase family esterase [Sphingopyxis sp.]MDZ3832186.1 PHB depolymerase family esterase [Sphingopyxis sp.]
MTRMRTAIRLALGIAALAASGQALAAPRCDIGANGTAQRIAIGTTGRSMLVHIPANARPGKPLALVFLLHGSGGNGAAMLERSGLAATADRYGFLVAAPDGGIPVDRGFVWNIPGVPTITGAIPTAADADDVAFLTGAIGWLADQGCADRRRVYATGLSGGGRMTSWLGCVAADRFAAIAPVVGLRAGNPLASDPRRPDPATCRPTHAMPVLAFAGDKDSVNPVEGGGAGYWQYPMDAALARWAQLGGCRSGPKRVETTSTTEESRYSRCRRGARVIGHIVRGGGHEWIADNAAMWKFFARYRR